MAKRKINLNKKVKRSVASTSSSKAKRVASESQLAALAKAREAKRQYAELRKSGFTRETAGEAGAMIEKTIDRLNIAAGGYNPAVAQLMGEIGYIRNQKQIDNMSKKEYYRYATSLRVFLDDSYSSVEETDRRMQDIIREATQIGLMKTKGERRDHYFKRRKEFIKNHEETAKDAFKLYRELENTSAGLILRSKYSPVAYGSDNLIVDLFDFVENDYDEDFDAALAFWRGMLEEQVEKSTYEKAYGKKMSKFEWRRENNYGIFKRVTEDIVWKKKK